MQFLIGADPELFLKDISGKFISSVGLIGGTKQEPQKISEVGHAIQEDNVAVEFNIPPASSATEFVSHLNFVLDHLRAKAANLQLSFAENVASASFPIDQLQTPEALTFGCAPDFNAWSGKMNPRPVCDDETLRSCGGHVHVGTTLDHREVIKAMDAFLGVPSVLLDEDKDRRKLYGKAGAYRSKVYGPEYRTLSNFWLWKDELKEWVFNQTQKAVDFVGNGNTVSKYHGMLIRRAINMGDTNAVKALGKTYSFGL